MQLKLTPASARDALPGSTLYDHEVTGLQLRCRATRKTWHLYYRTRDGKERRPALGTFPEMALSRAREVARDMKERIARGDDPSADWQAGRRAPTVADICDVYLDRHARRRKSERAAREDEWMITGQIKPGLGSMRAAEVTALDVDRFLDDVLHRKFWRPDKFHKTRPDGLAPSQRNHVRTLLRTIYNKARDDFDMLPPDHRNPVDKTDEVQTQKRRRKAEPRELEAIAAEVRKLAATHPLHAAVLTALFATGARKSEILRASVGDYQGGKIVRTKHKTAAYIGAKVIPLPAEVRELIERHDIAAGHRKSAEPLWGAIDLKRVWQRIRVAAGCPDLQLLDARRTFASYALSQGLTLDQIGKHFGHTDKQTTDGYAWLLEEAAQRVADTGAAAVMDVWKKGEA